MLHGFFKHLYEFRCFIALIFRKTKQETSIVSMANKKKKRFIEKKIKKFKIFMFNKSFQSLNVTRKRIHITH